MRVETKISLAMFAVLSLSMLAPGALMVQVDPGVPVEGGLTSYTVRLVASVADDIAAQLESMVPSHGKYRHLEGNAPAHIKASLAGDSEMLLVEDGRLILGTWQGIFFCEFDGPRNRTVVVKIVPDKP